MTFEKIVKRYNRLMADIGYESSTIGIEGWSEDTEGWNIRDMVAEADYWLSTYYEGGHNNYECRYEDYKRWLSDVGKLKRFIKRFEPMIVGVKCVSGHCSNYDNKFD